MQGPGARDRIANLPMTSTGSSPGQTGWTPVAVPYRIADAKLNATRAYNHPLWLRRKLPRDVVIEFDVMSKSQAGDIKGRALRRWRVFRPGQGTLYDPTRLCESSWVGGHNSNSIIGRLGEHDDAVKAQRRGSPASPRPWNQAAPTISPSPVRVGSSDWRLDGVPFLAWTDPSPLSGSGHEFFAVNDWEADVSFDNLRIRPAK